MSMNRRSFLAALAALPVVGKVLAQEPEWTEAVDDAYSVTMADFTSQDEMFDYVWTSYTSESAAEWRNRMLEAQTDRR